MLAVPDPTKPVYKIDRNGHAYSLLDTFCGAPGVAEADKGYANRIPCKKCRRARRERLAA